MQSLNITLKTLTPLWTGGVETGKMDRIHETGIIGSLRWWYEAIVRGLGGDVCNTVDAGCQFDPAKENAGLCPVCQLFGATGWRRVFRLQMGKSVAIFDKGTKNILIPSGRIHTNYNKRAGGWYIMADSVLADNLSLRFIPLCPVNSIGVLRVILSLIGRNASIAAKIASGYGIVESLEQGETLKIDTDVLNTLPSYSQPARGFTLPDIRDFFFAKFRFDEPANQDWWHRVEGINLAWAGTVTDNNYSPPKTNGLPHVRDKLQKLISRDCIPLAPAVRNWLRFQWFPTLFHSGRAPKSLEDYLFGRTGSQNNQSSKINVSHAYRINSSTWEFRIWGWIPCTLPDGLRLNRDKFLGDLQTALKQETIWQESKIPVSKVIEWHQLDSNNRQGRTYLEQLLGLNQEDTR